MSLRFTGLDGRRNANQADLAFSIAYVYCWCRRKVFELIW